MEVKVRRKKKKRGRLSKKRLRMEEICKGSFQCRLPFV